MGRELKRVPLDFTWPQGKVWDGYLNPHYAKKRECTVCDGTGESPESRRLKDLWYGYTHFRPEDRGSKPFDPTHPAIQALAKRNASTEDGVLREARRLAAHFNGRWCHHLNADDVAALVEAGRLVDLTHVFTAETRWQPKDPPYIPTPEEVNAWSLSGLGHDSINRWVVTEAECKRLGVASTCPHCEGEGATWDSPEDERACSEWAPTEPPAGEGYQVWETVSEGSPISPVFATPEELARHMERTRWGADSGTSFAQWMRFITDTQWAPSLVAGANGVRPGVQLDPNTD